MSIRCLGTVPVMLYRVFLGTIGNAYDSATKIFLPSEPMKTGVAGEAQDQAGYRLDFSRCRQADQTPKTPQEANKLERRLKQHPNDFDARKRLIDYYARIASKTHAAHTARIRHVLWIIQNQPADFESAHYATGNIMYGTGIGEDGKQKAAHLWKQQVSSHPRNVKVIRNAAEFFEMAESDYGIELLNRGQTLEPKNWIWPSALGHEYQYRMYRQSGKQRHETAEKALASFERWYRVTSEVHENDSLLPI